MNLVISIGLPRLPTDKEAKAAPNIAMLNDQRVSQAAESENALLGLRRMFKTRVSPTKSWSIIMDEAFAT